MSDTQRPRILVVGTGDTKADELLFLSERIAAAGGEAVMLDVSVLGDPPYTPAHDKHAVAAAAGTTIDGVAASGDENTAMTRMAEGAASLASSLYDKGDIDAYLAIGGTMGTDLALDVATALPIGATRKPPWSKVDVSASAKPTYTVPPVEWTSTASPVAE